MHPLVSVLTPSFNQARWLPDNLRSVAKQSYPVIEHVVVDGGSTDGSVALLEAASPGVIWTSEPDRGQSDAINKAFGRSTGEIIGWLNSDDAYFSQSAVADAVSIFEKHPAVGVVYGQAALVNGSGTLLYVLWSPPGAGNLQRLHNFVFQPTIFVRRSALARPDFVDRSFDYMMDRELWLYLSTRTHFYRLNEIVAIDRHHLMRKSYMRQDLAVHDDRVLVRQYRLPRIASNKVVTKVLTVGARLAGLSKVAEAARGSDCLTLDVPSLAVITARQIGQLRRWMPAGNT